MGQRNTGTSKTVQTHQAQCRRRAFSRCHRAAGGCIVAWNQQATASFGWFAYAPLSNDTFSGSGLTFVTQGTQIGLGIAVLGLLILAFWAGYRSGRRTGRTTNR